MIQETTYSKSELKSVIISKIISQLTSMGVTNIQQSIFLDSITHIQGTLLNYSLYLDVYSNDEIYLTVFENNNNIGKGFEGELNYIIEKIKELIKCQKI